MKSILTLGIMFLSSFPLYPNVNYIDINKITKDNNLISHFRYVKEHLDYFSHWTPEWNRDIPKEELKKKLLTIYTDFKKYPASKELHLLQGDLGHHLYNLDDTVFFRIAANHYKEAIQLDANEYRGYWFLGIHYSQANVPTEGIKNLLFAKQKLPKEEPIDFWEDLAWATAVANMPSSCIFAMDQIKLRTGETGYFEKQLGDVIRKRIAPVDETKDLTKDEIWSGTNGEYITLISRPLGMKIRVDSTWGISIFDYKNRQTALILNPPTIANKNGRDIHYTIAILSRVAKSDEKMENYLDKFTASYASKTKIRFSDKFENLVAFEIKEPKMYPELGGGHLYMIGVERKEPMYPGLLLESPFSFPKSDSGGLTFYQASDSRGRFKGRIFYAILLDTCEDIHDQSLKNFKEIFENLLAIE